MQPAHALIGGAREHHLAAGADAPDAQIGGAPIDGNPFGFDGHAISIGIDSVLDITSGWRTAAPSRGCLAK